MKAMQLCQKKLQSEVEALDKIYQKAQNGLEAGTVTAEEVSAVKAHLDGGKQRLKRVGIWGFAVYDFGASIAGSHMSWYLFQHVFGFRQVAGEQRLSWATYLAE